MYKAIYGLRKADQLWPFSTVRHFVKHTYVCHTLFRSSECLHMHIEVNRCSLQILLCVVRTEVCFNTCVTAADHSCDNFQPRSM